MKAIHRKRMWKLVHHLERGKLHHKEFNFAVWDKGEKINGCRTSGCAAGELPMLFPKAWTFIDNSHISQASTPVLFEFVRYRRKRDYPIDSLAKFFEISDKAAYYLFTQYGSGLPFSVSKKRVAKHLRTFLERTKHKKRGVPIIFRHVGTRNIAVIL